MPNFFFPSQERSKTYPATYPNGWYKIAESSEVPVGKVIEAQALGKVFAVFRGEDQKVAILDAYCVHLGANMAIGGRVVGNCLVWDAPRAALIYTGMPLPQVALQW